MHRVASRARLWALQPRRWRRVAGFQWAPVRDADHRVAAGIAREVRRDAERLLGEPGPEQPQDAFLEERPGGPGQSVGQAGDLDIFVDCCRSAARCRFEPERWVPVAARALPLEHQQGVALLGPPQRDAEFRVRPGVELLEHWVQQPRDAARQAQRAGRRWAVRREWPDVRAQRVAVQRELQLRSASGRQAPEEQRVALPLVWQPQVEQVRLGPRVQPERRAHAQREPQPPDAAAPLPGAVRYSVLERLAAQPPALQAAPKQVRRDELLLEALPRARPVWPQAHPAPPEQPLDAARALPWEPALPLPRQLLLRPIA